MRDRLVELIKKQRETCQNANCGHCGFASFGCYPDCQAKMLAKFILEDGWMRPPCKVGQTVWLIKSLNWQHTEWGIKEGKVSMIQQKADKSWKFRITENHSVSDYTVDAIGKTVFLTREDAEANMKEGDEE